MHDYHLLDSTKTMCIKAILHLTSKNQSTDLNALSNEVGRRACNREVVRYCRMICSILIANQLS